MNPKRRIAPLRHLQKVADWIVERSSQLGRSPPPRPASSSLQMQQRIHVRPRPLVQTMARNITQTEMRNRSVVQCACHGDHAVFGAGATATAYTCYPYDEYLEDSKVLPHHPHYDLLGAVGQQTAPTYASSSYDPSAESPRVPVGYAHYQ